MLKKTYRKIVKSIENLILIIHIIKTWLFEWISIIKKSEQYKDITWTSEQQKQFNDFWLQNYGKKISNRWHKLYQSINEVFNADYFPDILFSTKLEPILNSLDYCKFISDKSITEVLYSGVLDVTFPQTIIVNCSGFFYDNKRNIINKEKAIALVSGCKNIVVKPILGGSSGNSVQVIDLNEITQTNGKRIIISILKEYNQNYIVQDKIRANSQFSKLYPYSINTIRLITYIVKDEIHHAPLCLRMGNNKKKVDNIHAGGLVVGISDNGVLNQYAYKLGYANKKERYKAHPDTGVIFKDYQLPGTLAMIAVAKNLHKKTPHLGIISWDFTYDENDNVILVEGNYFGQSIWFPQIVHGKAIFGIHTKYMLDILKNERPKLIN